MIKSKRQLIEMLLSDSFKLNKKLIRRFLNMPQWVFEKAVKEDLNYNLEPVRKNLYIIS